MCTASWLISDNGYQVFFNRDELKTRKQAKPPARKEHHNIRYLAPIDSDAGGTWISVNEFGITLCLLNNYTNSQSLNDAKYLSRGQIISSMAHLGCLSKLVTRLKQVSLTSFKPFNLLMFEPGKDPCRLAWDGQQQQFYRNTNMPITSSSFKTEEVLKSRLNQLSDKHKCSEDQLIAFHHSHIPEKSARSVCMHRDEASTVSYSRIRVCDKNIIFEYKDGPPCKSDAKVIVSLSRQRHSNATRDSST